MDAKPINYPHNKFHLKTCTWNSTKKRKRKMENKLFSPYTSSCCVPFFISISRKFLLTQNKNSVSAMVKFKTVNLDKIKLTFHHELFVFARRRIRMIRDGTRRAFSMKQNNQLRYHSSSSHYAHLGTVQSTQSNKLALFLHVYSVQ